MLLRNALRLSLCHFSPFPVCSEALLGEGRFILFFINHIVAYFLI